MASFAVTRASAPKPVWRCEWCNYWEPRYEREVHGRTCPFCNVARHHTARAVQMSKAYRVQPKEFA